MRNYCEMMHKAVRYVVLLAATAVAGCTAVNDELGFSLVPGDQQMTIALDTLYGFDAYLLRTDSIPANSVGYVFLGSRQDPTFGRNSGKGVMQFSPDYSTWSTDSKFGPADSIPEPDSIRFFFYVNDIKGDTTVMQTFDIYELQDSIHSSNTYFIDFDAAPIIKPEKLASFTLRGPRHIDVTYDMQTSPELAEFMRRLFDRAYNEVDGNNIYEYDVDTPEYPWWRFHREFKGLYIRPADASPDNAALYSVSTETTDYTGMTLYAHYNVKDANGVDSAKVVTSHKFLFAASHTNASISMIAHDYSGSALDGLVNTTDDPKAEGPVTTSYVQTLGGVYTCVSIRKDELLQAMEEFKTHNGITYGDIVVNQARLEIQMDERTVDNMNRAPGRMGMYYDYPWLWRTSTLSGTSVTGNMPLVLDDYLYEWESSGYSIPFDGNLNRSRGFYNMDISKYIQKLLKDPEETQKDIYLAPDVSWTLYMRDVALKTPGTGEDGIKLILTYTLVK